MRTTTEGERALMSPETTTEPDEPAYRSIWTALCDVSFTQGWLDVGGVSTRYAEAGPADAPAVLMLHGTGGHWETFASNLGPMSKQFRCMAIDMVGNGFSGKPDIDYEIPVYVDHAFATLDVLGIERASMIGTSLGSWVAARSALTRSRPRREAGLMSPAGLVATESNMQRIRAERTAAVDNPTWATIKGLFDHLIADEKNRIPDIVAVRQAIYRLPDAGSHRPCAHPARASGARPQSHHGERMDDDHGADAGGRLGEGLQRVRNYSPADPVTPPRRQVLEMPNVRHWPHFEDPDVFNEAVIKFLLES